ncbi:hypothetical protein PENSPDRAFT_648102 [Peniophora sp. CONT]|nr:hypothetical protein PENSPDRAFT_648102 [Peniophora sp. CONT]
MMAEIGDQTFEFSAERIARMLAPKSPKPGKVTEHVRTGKVLLGLSDYDFAVDPVEICRGVNPPTYKRLQGNEERDVYDPLCAFLNDCIGACKNQLGTLTGALWPDLHFHSWDEALDERVGHTFSFKPDLVGVDSTNTNLAECYWSLPIILASSTEDPLELENGWLSLVAQAAIYARDMFSALPLRTFCIVIGLDHVENELRFMISHRGGLTATVPIDITKPEGANNVCYIFTAILLWKSPSDAGLPAFTNGKTLKLTEDCDVDVKKVLHTMDCVRGRSTWVAEISVGAPHQAQEPVPVVSSINHQKGAEQKQDDPSDKPTATGGCASGQTGSMNKPRSQPLSPLKYADDEGHKQSQDLPGVGRGTRSRTKVPSKSTVQKEEQKPLPPAVEDPQTMKRFYSGKVFQPLLEHKLSKPLEETAVLKLSWAEHEKRDLEPELLSRVSGEFGAPDYYDGSLVRDAHGIPVSNHLFLPKDAEVETCWWPLFALTHPSQPDHRTLNGNLGGERGTILTECEGEEDLVVCVLHAILGWLTWYQNGAFHRDVSIGNIIKLFTPKERKPFAVSSLEHLLKKFGSMKALGDIDLTALDHADDDAYQFLRDVEESRSQVDEQVKKMNVGVRCRAFLSDADCAADLWDNYFVGSHPGTLSGTPQFQSKELVDAIKRRAPYLQSPLDDMESYVWTTFWALLKHNSRDHAAEPDVWQTRLNAGALTQDIVNVLSAAREGKRFPPAESSDVADPRLDMLYYCATMLKRVLAALEPIRTNWRDDLATVNHARNVNLRPALTMLLFHKYAYRGASAVLSAWKYRDERDVTEIEGLIRSLKIRAPHKS